MVKSTELKRGMVVGTYPIRTEAYAIGRRQYVVVRCECGKLKQVRADHLDRKNQCRCGDRVSGISDKRHPLHGTWRSWLKMKDRVLNPNHTHHDHYGGRGITICQRWLDSFECFAADMGPRPSPKHSIDRIDNDKDYEPGNCKWSTAKEQNRNKTDRRCVTWNGRTMSVTEWADVTGISRYRIYTRLNRGWSPEAALTYPEKPRMRHVVPPQTVYGKR